MSHFTRIGTIRITPSLMFNGTPTYQGPPDQTGKVVAITGGNTGIGYQVTKSLLAANAKVYLFARSPDRAAQAIESLKKETGKDNIHYIQLDLASLHSVKAAAEMFLEQEQTLHVLFNNAGVLGSKPGQTTADGFEFQSGTNILGHHVFTSYLMPVLTRTAKKSSDGISRVVSTGSFVQWMGRSNEMNFQQLERGGPKGINSWDLYCRSKLGNSLWTNAMARRHTAKGGVVFLTVNPGLIASEGMLEQKEVASWIAARTMAHPTTSGAASILYAGTSPDITKVDTAGYYVPWCKKGTQTKAALDTKQQDQLYDIMESWRVKILG